MTGRNPFAAETYDYELPQELIAQQPAEQRDASRLFALMACGSRRHLMFSDLPALLRPGDVLVANDTRVLRARFFPKRAGGGAAQVLLLHKSAEPDVWLAMARPGKRVRPGDRLALSADAGIEIVDRAPGGNRLVKFYGIDASEAMRRYGVAPLPPYIRTPPRDADDRYQTVYAASDGSVAAPTAGLHFSEALLAQLTNAGIEWVALTLHVGAGTFRPVKTADVRRHVMHEEYYDISQGAAAAISRAKKEGRRIVAVGTTSLRALEDAAAHGQEGVVSAASGWTSLFVYPGYVFRTVDALITNFHLPRSTLLMLVCALAGTQRVLDAYAEAARLRYRFYSFGDAMYLERAR
ncbi:MAG: tRNA preQ1(34) S-adenosylmethionine ribosyltransferase-isomerase QueA [Candidatus Eremiobacter antarcticus]|nr:tRNA preQ1(34) S-adenosylmethionine ribosyltransferase-isomerase QueA [Candidatus Eremiobacteraeota bacterium]MBC5807690.1 tRNA preQ1(34) S-adenosylmethionine ribosyltransferase-isomerase QueA [Candidatus Eremiobacteraeota bacterium]PZR60489.1 MAG: tRNA preQ1(34) S-adenosylmethionine ribosyltransferase-isomerase QueA [Candidatus Eremiobacter sp. RRmetagenome_bin22]